jgi:amidohydrolase
MTVDKNAGRDILKLAYELRDEVTAWRREFHQHPELGFQEFHTAEVVARVLQQLGLKVQKGIGRTGVVAFLDQGGKRTIGLRADMDALPILEENDVPYRSRKEGVMHACGHDAHTAILLGAACLLTKMRNTLPGNVKFIFQPAEEVEDGGAVALIREGVLKDPPVDGIIGLHLINHFPSGSIGVARGTITAAVDNFEVEVLGRGGHAARPHEAVDSIVIAAQIIDSIQSLVTRETDSLEPKVITVGEILGGTAPNVIAGKTRMRGTIRTLTIEMRNRICRLFEERCKKIAGAMGGEASVKIKSLLPPQINHPGLYEVVKEAGLACLGEEKVIEYNRPSMGGEDFAFYSQIVPGVYFRLGTQDEEKGFVYPLHNARFNFDESILPLGVAVMATSAIMALTADWKKTS